MKIIKAKDSIHSVKPEGIDVRYYLFPSYEIHYNEQAPHTTQRWHHHEKISETLYLIEGELIAKWRDDKNEKSEKIFPGDIVETENTPHTFSNETNETARFLVLRHVDTGDNYSELFKSDKVVD